MPKFFKNLISINHQQRNRTVYLLLFALCLCTFSNALFNDFVADDFLFIKGNYDAFFRSLADFFLKAPSHHYNPIYYLVNVNLFEFLKGGALSFHIVNLVLFYVDLILLFRLVLLLTGRFDLAFLTSSLFAVHPVNAMIVKPNQIGTMNEVFEAIHIARKEGWKLIASHRSGETDDTFITDLAVGIGAYGLKAGAPTQRERRVKYERLNEIVKEMEAYH